ncbi:MAG: DMT family transporter [Cyanobacteria bacterium J06642_2]
MNAIVRGRSFVVGSALLLAVQNVFLRVLFTKSWLFGWYRVGGIVPANFEHSLLLLWMRSLVMVGLMLPLAPYLYGRTFAELRALYPRSRLTLQVIGSGVTLFFTLILLYVAIANLATGVAIALFFLYPAFTPVLTRWILRERFTILRAIATVCAILGIALTSPGLTNSSGGDVVVGVGAALAAALIFSIHGIFAQICLKSLHPVPFTLATFLTIVLLGGLWLPVLPLQIPKTIWLPLWVCCAVMAVLSIAAYTLSNFGIRDIGVTAAFLIGASSPMFTAMAAAIAIEELLLWRQWFGIACITAGIFLLGLEKMPRLVDD